MKAREERRRKRTRGLLLLAVLVVATVLAGTEGLLRLRPHADTESMIVDDLPVRSLSAANPRTCLRGVEGSGVEEIQNEMVNGGRISAAQVEGCPQAFDGLRVTFAGEAVGDILERDGGAWVQVNDDDYALEVGPLGRHDDRRGFNTGLAVWLPDGLHEQLSGVGSSRRRGDVILVEGVLHRADPADGGGTTLRADELTVLAPSVAVEEPLHVPQAIVALVLAVVALVLLVWSRTVRAR